MKMKRLKNMKRVLIVIMLVAMLIPVLAVTAYASDRYRYSFSYNGNGGVMYRSGTKTDTSYAAAASILESNMNGGSVKFRLERSNGSDLSYWTGSYYGNGNCPLYYYSNVALTNPMAVRLAGSATASVRYISGNFQP